MKEFLMREGVPEEKMVVMPNGIDPAEFSPAVNGAEVRRRYGLEGKLVIGFVGWFRQWHGLEMLLEVLNEGGLARAGVRLLLVGDGPAYETLHSYAEAHGLLSAVAFTGPVARRDIPSHIAAMDIAAQPSATEYACPMKILEYMGMGRCIVAPDQPNIREIIDDGKTGFLFRPGDKENLQEVLAGLARDRMRIETAGRNACRAVFERGFLWSENARRTLGLVFGSGATRGVDTDSLTAHSKDVREADIRDSRATV